MTQEAQSLRGECGFSAASRESYEGRLTLSTAVGGRRCVTGCLAEDGDVGCGLVQPWVNFVAAAQRFKTHQLPYDQYR